MTYMCRRSTFGAVLVAALCLLLSPVTQAGAPDKIPPFTNHYPAGPMASCMPYGYSFDLLVESTFYGSGKAFKDRNGDVVRIELHLRTDDIFSNSVTGKSVIGHANYKESIDVAADESTFRGHFWHIVVPGVGNVLQDAEFQIVSWDPFEVKVIKGTYQANEGEFGELCAALN